LFFPLFSEKLDVSMGNAYENEQPQTLGDWQKHDRLEGLMGLEGRAIGDGSGQQSWHALTDGSQARFGDPPKASDEFRGALST
jgi:hypothetical protein